MRTGNPGLHSHSALWLITWQRWFSPHRVWKTSQGFLHSPLKQPEFAGQSVSLKHDCWIVHVGVPPASLHERPEPHLRGHMGVKRVPPSSAQPVFGSPPNPCWQRHSGLCWFTTHLLFAPQIWPLQGSWHFLAWQAMCEGQPELPKQIAEQCGGVPVCPGRQLQTAWPPLSLHSLLGPQFVRWQSPIVAPLCGEHDKSPGGQLILIPLQIALWSFT